MRPKKLILTLSCGHSITLEKMQAAASMRGLIYECPKCSDAAPPRRVTERAWVDAGSNTGGNDGP